MPNHQIDSSKTSKGYLFVHGEEEFCEPRQGLTHLPLVQALKI